MNHFILYNGGNQFEIEQFDIDKELLISITPDNLKISGPLYYHLSVNETELLVKYLTTQLESIK